MENEKRVELSDGRRNMIFLCLVFFRHVGTES